jgi:hypothetical protein
MKLNTANTIRIGAAVMTVLIIVSVSQPSYGIPLGGIWLAVVIWQMFKQRRRVVRNQKAPEEPGADLN